MDFFFDRSIAGEGKIPTRVDGYPAEFASRGLRKRRGLRRSERKKERASPDDAETDKTANDNRLGCPRQRPSVSDYPR